MKNIYIQKSNYRYQKEVHMMNYAITFFIIAIVAAVFGFTNIAGSAIDIAKMLFVFFLIISVAAFIFGRRKLVV